MFLLVCFEPLISVFDLLAVLLKVTGDGAPISSNVEEVDGTFPGGEFLEYFRPKTHRAIVGLGWWNVHYVHRVKSMPIFAGHFCGTSTQ